MTGLRLDRCRGISMVELAVAIAIVGVALIVMLHQLTISYRENSMNEIRTFAYQKAMALFVEIENAVERGEITDAEALDLLDDNGRKNSILTIATEKDGSLLPAEHPMSGNMRRKGQWLWSRSVQVQVEPQQERMRYVKVKVFHRQANGTWTRSATIGGLMPVPVKGFQSVKVYDVYLLAMAETPSLWLSMPSLRVLMDGASEAIETIENGLDLRLHWITRLGYGRDRLYTPYVNTVNAASAAAPFAYWYPGKLDGSTPLYTADLFSGRVRTESGVLNDYDAVTNRFPHAVADQFNHCLRAPAARELFEQRLAAGLEKEDEPPLQILLEDLQRDPERYRNAIFVNLHGEGLPMPPLRNFSDAAKDPVGHPHIRAVTHPARLWTPRDPNGDGNQADSQSAEFRVYAYKTDPNLGPVVLQNPITVQIMGLDLTGAINDPVSPTLEIRRLVGGVDPSTGTIVGMNRAYAAFDSASGLPPSAPGLLPNQMYYQAGFVAGPKPYTWIKLYNTPLVAPMVGTKGLATSERLFGMEYIPSPVVAGGAFSADLSSAGGTGQPKNTARWRIRIPATVFQTLAPAGFGLNEDRLVTVVTRIGTDFSTGQVWPVSIQPGNVSRTYTWWASSVAAVPVTERFQFQGDPRHNPYADLVVGGASSPNGYNWHFDDLRDSVMDATGKWPAFDPLRLEDSFAAGVVVDAPRMMQLLRDGLQRSGAILVNPRGKIAGSLLLGGEMAQPAPSPLAPLTAVPLHASLFGGSGIVQVDSITPSVIALPSPPAGPVKYGRHVIMGTGVSPFWAKEWLGELCPDEAWATYQATGNLPVGLTPGTFHRELRSEAVLPGLPQGSDYGFVAGSSMATAGSVSLMNTGTLAATFLHQITSPKTLGVIAPPLQELADALGETLPNEMTAAVPFGTNLAFPGQLPSFTFSDSYPKSFLALLEQHYMAKTGPLTAAGLVSLEAPSTLDTAFFVVLGMTPANTTESEAMARAALMEGVRSFQRAGQPGVIGRITQTPQVEIMEPVEATQILNATSLLITWRTSFTRFDGSPLTDGYPAGFAEPEQDLFYTILYSRDQGETWRNVIDDQLAIAGKRPDNTLLWIPDAGAGTESYLLSTPVSKFPGAEYLFRVECYHRTRMLHLSHHEVRVKIVRSSGGGPGG